MTTSLISSVSFVPIRTHWKYSKYCIASSSCGMAILLYVTLKINYNRWMTSDLGIGHTCSSPGDPGTPSDIPLCRPVEGNHPRQRALGVQRSKPPFAATYFEGQML